MRRTVITLVMALSGVGIVSPATAGACTAGTHSHAATGRHRIGRAPLVVGDSTSIIAAPMLGRLGLEADARGCRTFGQGVEMLAARHRAHTLPHVVAMALGANAATTSGQVSAAVRVMGRHRVLALVTARMSGVSNAAMQRAARRYPDRVVLVDWVRFSAGHGGWFAGDGLHVGREGASAYAHLIRRAVAPFAFPPVGLLKIGRPGERGKRCSNVRRGGRSMRVYVPRGDRRVTCARARALVHRPPLRPATGWKVYDWRASRSRTWSWVYARRDRKVLVGAVAGT